MFQLAAQSTHDPIWRKVSKLINGKEGIQQIKNNTTVIEGIRNYNKLHQDIKKIQHEKEIRRIKRTGTRISENPRNETILKIVNPVANFQKALSLLFCFCAVVASPRPFFRMQRCDWLFVFWREF